MPRLEKDVLEWELAKYVETTVLRPTPVKECTKDFCVQCGASHKKTCYTCKPKGSGSGPLGFLKGIFGK